MELNAIVHKMKGKLHKFKYAVLILAVGLIFLLLPAEKETAEPAIITEPKIEESIEAKLERIIRMIDGAGDVRVLVTTAVGEEILFQEDEDLTQSDDSMTSHTTTITVTGSDKEETGLVRQVIPPQYLGAVVVCQGADKPSIRLAIVDAVSKATGLGADRISVLKMK